MSYSELIEEFLRTIGQFWTVSFSLWTKVSQTLQSVLCITTNKYLVRVLVVLNNFPVPKDKVNDLNFGMYFLYTWCTNECFNRLGRTPICRDSRVNHMFRNTFPMRDYCIIHLSLGE